jgi:hypothetical protein
MLKNKRINGFTILMRDDRDPIFTGFISGLSIFIGLPSYIIRLALLFICVADLLYLRTNFSVEILISYFVISYLFVSKYNSDFDLREYIKKEKEKEKEKEK